MRAYDNENSHGCHVGGLRAAAGEEMGRHRVDAGTREQAGVGDGGMLAVSFVVVLRSGVRGIHGVLR